MSQINGLTLPKWGYSKLAALSDALHQGVDQTAQGSVMLRLSQINVALVRQTPSFRLPSMRQPLDDDEALPLQAFEYSERRRQQFTALAVVPTPACDRRLDGDDQELGRHPFVTRLHWQFFRVGKTDSVLPAIYSRPRLKIFKPKI